MTVWDDDWNPALNTRHPVIKLDPDGVRFRALVAPWDSCIQDANAGPGVCLRPPRDHGDYEYAHVAGNAALIPAGLGHADPTFGISAAGDVYANTDLAVMAATYSEDDLGIWAEGELMPGLTPRQLKVIEKGGLSGDWRWVEEEERHRMIASQLVTTTGFRKANGKRQYAMTASAATAPGLTHIPNALFSMPEGYVAAAEPDFTGSILAAIAIDGPVDWSDIELPHLTLAYGGKLGDENQPDLDMMRATLKALAEETEPFSLLPSGGGFLGSEDAYVVFVEAPPLQALNFELRSYARSEHSGFLPHVSVSYPPEEGPDERPFPKRSDFPDEIFVTKLILAVGEEVEEFPLGRPSAMAALAAALKSRR